MAWRVPRWRTVALSCGATVVVLMLAGLLFAASGLYNVAARRGHFDITTWLIELTLHRSVALRSRFVDVPQLDDSDLVRLGAAHFQAGCAPCHGAPGLPRNPIVRNMLPPPPDLSHAVNAWSDRQLFWIIDNGLKYTGMPAWPAPARKDEVWAMVAFLRQLPALEAEAYGVLAYGGSNPAVDAPRHAGWSADLLACSRCHDSAERPPASRLVPRLAGQSPAYFAAALRAYQSGRRQSGIMQPVAAALDDAAIERLANHYAELPAPRGTQGPAPADKFARGRSIATIGVPQEGIPPCLTCHAGRFAPYPRIAGQSAAYIRQQLHLWQAGLRDQTVPGQIMAPIARRLNASQIEDVAAYLELLDPDVRLGGVSP
jgi:cytochrome c553